MKLLPLCVLVVVTVLVLLAHAAIEDRRAIRVTMTPLVSFAPSRFAIQVRVHPVLEDRWISVWADSGDFSRVSGFSIEGDRVLYTVDWPGIPAGEYLIIASIGHGDVTRAQDRLTARVQGNAF